MHPPHPKSPVRIWDHWSFHNVRCRADLPVNWRVRAGQHIPHLIAHGAGVDLASIDRLLQNTPHQCLTSIDELALQGMQKAARPKIPSDLGGRSGIRTWEGLRPRIYRTSYRPSRPGETAGLIASKCLLETNLVGRQPLAIRLRFAPARRGNAGVRLAETC